MSSVSSYASVYPIGPVLLHDPNSPIGPAVLNDPDSSIGPAFFDLFLNPILLQKLLCNPGSLIELRPFSKVLGPSPFATILTLILTLLLVKRLFCCSNSKCAISPAVCRWFRFAQLAKGKKSRP
jgi:hypothetical protein